MSPEKKIITRIAPSPTGNLHVGTARSALFNYLFAKRHGGEFLVRIEDTDRKRSSKEFEADILDGLSWLNLSHDGLFRQSERTALYRKRLEELLAADTAYRSTEASKEREGEQVEVIRLRNPGKKVSFTDLIRGVITFDTSELGDFVIARSIEDPLYHFAVVVDDFDMAVSHVIRGEDHISNTPRQILIAEALKMPHPQYAHLPLILAPDRSKLSKRHGAVSIREYRDMGYLPEAFVNYLALLGWNPGDDRELFSLEELSAAFDLGRVQKGGAIFNTEKLGWFNREYILRLPPQDRIDKIEMALPPEVRAHKAFTQRFNKIVPIIEERIEKFSDIEELFTDGELSFFFTNPSYNPSDLVGKNSDIPKTITHLEMTLQTLTNLPENQFTKEAIQESIWDYASEQGRGAVLWPLRFALTGKKTSPDPFTTAEALGKEETLKRISYALEVLNNEN